MEILPNSEIMVNKASARAIILPILLIIGIVANITSLYIILRKNVKKVPINKHLKC